MKKVILFGTFDIFHEGHKDFFRQAREYGEYLIVVVARDKNVLKAKGRLPKNNELARQKEIFNSRVADIVVLGDLDDKYKVIQKFMPDAICVGYDQKFSKEELKEKLIKFDLGKTQIVRLKSFHPEIYKSSKLRQKQQIIFDMQEKQILVDNLKINYKIIGDGNIPIILLHGWGVDSDKYSVLAEYLSEVKSEKLKVKSYRIYLLDLPGFGKSDNPPEPWGVDEYAEFVKKLTKLLFCHPESLVGEEGSFANAKDRTFVRDSSVALLPQNDKNNASFAQNDKKESQFILIGHSFGGQIAIKFSAQYPEMLRALILTGAAGIRHQPAMKQKVFYILAKIGKIVFSLPIINKFEKSAQKLLYRVAREKDYYEAQGIMKEIFKKVIKEDLTDDLKKNINPTLLVWGAKDGSTPLVDGRLMSLRIKNCVLKIVGEANHSLPYQYPEKFAKIAVEFIKKDNG